MGSLLPFCRTHSARGTPDQEPWSFGEKTEKIAQKYIKLRYQLMPYLYTWMRHACLTGMINDEFSLIFH